MYREWDTSLSDSTGIRTHNHLVPKWAFSHLTKLAEISQTSQIMKEKFKRNSGESILFQ